MSFQVLMDREIKLSGRSKVDPGRTQDPRKDIRRAKTIFDAPNMDERG
jgi:hypothetical protein